MSQSAHANLRDGKLPEFASRTVNKDTMISRITGQVSFDDDLQIEAHMKLPASHIQDAHEFMVPGWRGCHLGIHRSDRGDFDTTAIVDSECRVQLVFAVPFSFLLPF